jgi:hypothetical protein
VRLPCEPDWRGPGGSVAGRVVVVVAGGAVVVVDVGAEVVVELDGLVEAPDTGPPAAVVAGPEAVVVGAAPVPEEPLLQAPSRRAVPSRRPAAGRRSLEVTGRGTPTVWRATDADDETAGPTVGLGPHDCIGR